MLSFFRRGFMAKVALGILFLIVVAMVITGFGTGGTGGLGDLAGRLGSDTVASVGSEKITTDRVRSEATRQLDRSRQQNPELDMAGFVRRGALDEVVDQLITVTGGLVFGAQQGLAATKRMLDAEIVKIPAFQGVTGQFDQNAFRAALNREKMTEDDLRQELRTRLMERQLVLPVAGSPFVPQSLANQYAALLLETRSGMVGAVPTKAMGPGAEPAEADLQAWYRQNIGRYTIPERRIVRYAVFGAENVAAQAKASDAEIAAAYSRNPAYAARETRSLSQVVLPDEKAARAFAQKIASGTPFAQAAAQAGYAAADIAVGDKTQSDYARMSAPEVANAVFAAAKGATIGPIRSGLGWHVVRVDDVKTIGARPLAAVRAEIAAGIERQKAQAALGDMATRIENAVSGGASFADAVKAEKLAIVETPPVTGTGQAPDAPAGWTAPPELAPLLRGAFQMDASDQPAVETVVPNQRYALVSVARVVPAAPPPLAQIRDRVKIDLMAWRAAQRGKAIAQSIVSKINAGVAPALAFAQAGVRLPAPQPLSATRRDLAKQGQQVPPALAMLFSLPRGKARLLDAGEARGWFIVYLDKVVPGDASKDPGLIQAVRSQFGQIISDEYAQQFSAAVRSQVKVKRNDKALAKLKSELMANVAAQ
ncbi:MAG: peptidyl-prolyl cis-trans isomerase [Sphingomonadales bacterium]|jgi:peptidyl-prolyl cis-trans isomerase D|nr:peptidyl-prolyl cis-trans isomerase [Sphingomonadales bacterium]